MFFPGFTSQFGSNGYALLVISNKDETSVECFHEFFMASLALILQGLSTFTSSSKLIEIRKQRPSIAVPERFNVMLVKIPFKFQTGIVILTRAKMPHLTFSF